MTCLGDREQHQNYREIPQQFLADDCPAARKVKPMSTETITILLVEDNLTDACLVQERLQEVVAFSYQLFHVSRLKDALAYLSATPSISVILLALSVPDAIGITIVQQLLLVAPDTPIVVMSDGYDEAIALQLIKQGAQDYLVKSQTDGKILVCAILYALARQDALRATVTFNTSKQVKPVEVNGATVCDRTRNVQVAMNTHQEILERKCQEKALRESEAKFRTLYEQMGAAMILLDEKGIFDANCAALQMFGYTNKEQLYRKLLHDVSPPLQPDGEDSVWLASQYMVNAIAQGSCRFDWMYCNCNGEEFPTEVTLAQIELGNRKVLQAVIYDISDRKATQMQLLQAKEAAEAGSHAKSEFLATVSHELRTPLNAILGLSQLMQQEIHGKLNEKQKEYFSCIQSSGEHLLALINDILDLSKVEAGKEQLTFVPIDIQQLCDYCLAMVREQAYEQGLQLSLHIEPQARIVVADERRCKQMLLNLLSNAVKFTPVGEVSLIVTKQTEGICFTVKDTGIGIASDQVPLLFEPFRQLDSGLNRHFPGTGLGLALTQSLARLHGGDVTVKSTLGQGSEFTLCLPDWRKEELILPASPHEDGKLEGYSCPIGAQSRILLVDNDERSALVLKDYLQIIGHRVEHLTHERDFLQTVRQFKPNLILMDVQLQGENRGLDLLATLRREPDTKKLKVVMVEAVGTAGNSQGNSVASRERCLEVGADDYLSKPIGIAQLEAILMRYI